MTAFLTAQKIKPSKSNVYKAFSSGGSVAHCLRQFASPFWEALQRKPVFAALTAFFFIVALMKASFQRAPIKKPGSSIQAFSSSGGRT